MSTLTAPTPSAATSPRPLALTHECDEVAARPAGPKAPTADRSRIVGIDAARGLALIGMFAVHTFSSTNADGDLSLAWQLSSGKSSALFAVLGGVGIAFMTGRNRPPRGSRWARAAVTPLVRGVLIALIGLLLAQVVSSNDANIILPYLGVMFLASALVLPLRARTLVALGLSWAVLAPIVSHLVRPHLAAPPTANLTFADVFASPAQSLGALVFTGFFPALTWFAYICVGMGIGRSDLRTRRVTAWLIGGGLALTVASAGVSAALVAAGLRDRLAADVAGHTSLETFTEYLVWGSQGVLPTDSAWWLGVDAPHTGTPVDLLHTIGISLVVIGLFLALAVAAGPMLHVLVAPGSMTLTLYSAHLLLLGPLRGLPDAVHFLVQVVALVTFALAWSSRFSKGPLEWVVAKITHAIAPRPGGRAPREAARN